MQGRNVLESFFEFDALLASFFSLTFQHAQQQGARRYAHTFITVLTALTIHLYQVENILVAFSTRFAAYSKCSLCHLALFSAICKFLSSCFNYLFMIFWRWGSARVTQRRAWDSCPCPRPLGAFTGWSATRRGSSRVPPPLLLQCFTTPSSPW